MNKTNKVKRLQKINRVRLYKRVFLPFELVNVDRKQLMNTYYNSIDRSSIQWKMFGDEIKKEKPSKADLKEWTEFLK